MDYYERAGLPPVPGEARLQPGRLRLHHLHRQLRAAARGGQRRGRRATTWPWSSVLSGNRNFEGRINPDVKMNYLASPPLVVAYALAGTMDLDLTTEPLGTGADGTPVYLRDIWPSRRGDRRGRAAARSAAEMFTRDYADVFAGDDRWRALTSRPATRSPGTRTPPTCGGRRTSTACRRAGAGHRHPRARGCSPARRLGHHRPHLAGRRDQDRQPGRAVPDRARRPAAATSTPTAPGAATTR